MKRILLIVTLLCIPIQVLAADKIAIFFANTNASPTEDRLMCVRRIIDRGGWQADWFNADARTWQTGNDDGIEAFHEL